MAKHNEAVRFKLCSDFNESTLIDAMYQTKATPSEITMVVGPTYYDQAITLAAKYHARLVLVPEGFMKPDQWLVIGPEASAWSEGC